MLAELSPKTPLQPSAIAGSLQAETGKKGAVKIKSGFVTSVLSPLFFVNGGWRARNESIS